MHGIRRQVVEQAVPVLVLGIAFGLMWFGINLLSIFREPSVWPQLPLVSVPRDATQDVWSSVPGLLDVGIAALHCVLLVEMARLCWLVNETLTPRRFVLTLLYDVALTIDTFRRWGRDWFVWALHELGLSGLCEPAEPCYPVSGAVPWMSVLMLSLLLITLIVPRRLALK